MIGNKNYSSWSLRPWPLLRHFNIPFTEKRVTLFNTKMKQELSPNNSNTKIPVLQDGDIIIWDSLAILEYLSEKHLENKD